VRTDHDVVIVGGGPAGLTTALALARLAPRLAARSVVLEGHEYPREKPCAGGLGGRGERILEELDALPDVPHVPISGMSLRGAGRERAVRVTHIGRVIRRVEFDHALARAVAARGVPVHDGTKVTGFTRRDDGRVEVSTSRGLLRARVVVGADGVGSVVRKAMGLGKGRLSAQVLEVDTEPVAGERDRALLHFDAGDRRFTGYTWDFPTVVAGRELVCRGIYHLKLERLERAAPEPDLVELFRERLVGMGLSLASYRQKRFAERGFDPEEPVADGRLMLVGEAAGIDPITGEGIAQAIEMGALAARYLADTGAELGTSGWTSTLRGSRVARDLGVRRCAVPLFYGPERPHMEAYLTARDEPLFVGAQYFADLRVDRARLATVALTGGLALARARLEQRWPR
jgi:flavin-dependent dehydrogenase